LEPSAARPLHTAATTPGPLAASGKAIYLPIITRPANPPVIASFSASPASIAPGGASTLRWSVSGATSLSIAPSIGAVSGSSIAIRPATTTRYTLTATNADGGVTAQTTVTVTGGGANNQGFLFLPSSGITEDPSVAIDATGGIHVAYSSFVNGRQAAYSYCAASCARSSSWTAITIGAVGLLGGYVTLALDSAGRPRMMWYNDTGLSDGNYVYASCDQSCTSAASWKVVQLTGSSNSPAYHSHYFALNPQGLPRFIYDAISTSRTGTYLGFCNETCTSIDNWFTSKIDDTYLFGDYSLAFDAAGRPRLALSDGRGSPHTLDYLECDVDCTNPDNWIGSVLYDLDSGFDFTLRLDSAGRPRIALYAGSTGSGQLYYAWCNIDCTFDTNWSRFSLKLPEDYGGDVDLALDSQNRPRMSYHAADNLVDERLAFSWCNTNCQTATPSWQSTSVETSDQLNTRVPIPPSSGCSIATWSEIGWYSALALDPLGNPRISYNTTHLQGGTCQVHEDLRLARVALFNQP
jgi:hypothetical protein